MLGHRNTPLFSWWITLTHWEPPAYITLCSGLTETHGEPLTLTTQLYYRQANHVPLISLRGVFECGREATFERCACLVEGPLSIIFPTRVGHKRLTIMSASHHCFSQFFTSFYPYPHNILTFFIDVNANGHALSPMADGLDE